MSQPVEKIIPAYPFVQYRDDLNVVAFFKAYNIIAQQYLEAFNALYLPCWTSPLIKGYLLDWVALGIYGVERPLVQTSTATIAEGAYNTVEYNDIYYAHMKSFHPGTFQHLPDDYFKRILTWNFYKGDGFQFSVEWLKRRIARFIHGESGADPLLENTFDVSVTSKNGKFTLKIPEYGDGVGEFLVRAINTRLVNLPFIYTYEAEAVSQ
jgi:hypothetical protein